MPVPPGYQTVTAVLTRPDEDEDVLVSYRCGLFDGLSHCSACVLHHLSVGAPGFVGPLLNAPHLFDGYASHAHSASRGLR